MSFQSWPRPEMGCHAALETHRRMLGHMRSKAERAIPEAERAVEEAASAFEAASADWLMVGAQQDLAWQRKRQHDLDHHGIALMDKGGITT